MLGTDHIKGQLNTTWAAQICYYKEVTDSTNNDAKKLGEEGAPHGTLVVADKQENGRGSRGRKWETPSGTNIAMSLLLRPDVPSQRISMLTLIMGLSVAQGIESALLTQNKSIKAQIKWPNDVVIADKKICGILTELHMNDDNTINNVVVGVGINVNMEEFPTEIKDIAGSVLSTTGVKLDRGLVVAKCMEHFEKNYEAFLKTFDLSLLKEEYEKRLINKDRQVRVLDPAGEYEAIALGIDELGALIVKNNEGKILNINAGEVTVRGLYSYV